MCGFLVGLACAGFACAVIAISPTLPNEPWMYIIAAILALIVGTFEFNVLAEVINSGVATTFVCLAEDPVALQRTKPELFEKIRSTYPAVQCH